MGYRYGMWAKREYLCILAPMLHPKFSKFDVSLCPYPYRCLSLAKDINDVIIQYPIKIYPHLSLTQLICFFFFFVLGKISKRKAPFFVTQLLL